MISESVFSSSFNKEKKKKKNLSRGEITIMNISQPDSFHNVLTKETPIHLVHSIHSNIDNKAEDCFQLYKKQNSRRSMLSISSGETDKDHATFSSLSNYTLDEDKLFDLNRQVEELHCQLTVTQERNQHVENELVSVYQNHTKQVQHLLEVQSTQDELIQALEHRYQQVQHQHISVRQLSRELSHLSLDKQQLVQQLAVFERMLSKQDQDNCRAIEGLEHIKHQWSTQNKTEPSHDPEQVELLRSQRDRFYHQWKHQIQQSEKTQQALELELARNQALERQKEELTSDLEISQELLRQQDASGRIQRLESEIEKVKGLKRCQQEDFESSHEQSLNEIKSLKHTLVQRQETIDSLQSTHRVLHQQLSEIIEKRQPGALASLNPEFSKSGLSLVSTYGDADLMALKEKIEQEEKMEKVCLENAKLRLALQDKEVQMATERHHQQDCCRLDRSSQLSSNSTIQSPPSDPPSQPIPPLPKSPDSDRNTPREDSLAHLELKLLEQQTLSDQKLKSATKQIEELRQALKQETQQRLKAQDTQQILKSRMNQLMNKKNKYLCF